MASLAAQAAARVEFWTHVDFLGDCWMWTGSLNRAGYGRLTFSGRSFTAHRCAYEFLLGAIPSGMFACHHCDEPPCVRPDHLFLGAAVDNTRDMIQKNRGAVPPSAGSANGHARLDELRVLEIRERFAAGETPGMLAATFGVSSSSINGIIRGSAWAHVDGPICTLDRRGLHRRRKVA